MNKILIASLMAFVSQLAAADDLLQVYNMAVEKDPVLREAAAVRESRRESRPLAMAQLLPNVSASGDLNYNNVNTHSLGDESYGTGSLGINLLQPIYRRDRFIRLEQADWQLELADAEYRAQEQDLMLRVATAYFDILSAQEGVTFVRADKKAIARQLEQAKQRFEVGLIAITGVHEAQARYDQAVTDEIVAQNELDNAWEDLRQILGIRPEALAGLKEKLELEPPTPAAIDEWSAFGLENNPAVKVASDATQIAQREIEVQNSGHYPSLDLVGRYSGFQTNQDNRFDVDNGNIGLQLNVPLYAGGGVTAATRQARADLIAAQERLDQARRSTDKAVRNAYRGVQASISAVRALEAAIVSTKSALEATTAGFEVGTRTLVDVLNSQRDYYRSQRDFARARYVYLVNMLRLRQAAGVLSVEDLEKVNSLLVEK
ncbi:MAG TPA: type I secretion protein TolC [Chromatiaceae bacterium]|nr:type I secretion protein TolC [Chromatiaceae bacterium]